MNKILLISILFLVGCHSRGLDHLFGKSDDRIPFQTAPTQIQGPIRLLVWGQSNAKDPEAWEEIKSNLLTRFSSVEIKNIAVSNTNSFQWSDKSGPLYQEFINQAQTFSPNLILGIQGEGDGYTTPEEYYSNIKSIMDDIKSLVPEAYIGMAICSYYGAYPFRNDNVREGQGLLFDRGVLHQGPDVDIYRTNPDLAGVNGLHFNEDGDRQIGRDWARILDREIIPG